MSLASLTLAADPYTIVQQEILSFVPNQRQMLEINLPISRRVLERELRNISLCEIFSSSTRSLIARGVKRVGKKSF
jgi:hypothetical protein